MTREHDMNCEPESLPALAELWEEAPGSLASQRSFMMSDFLLQALGEESNQSIVGMKWLTVTTSRASAQSSLVNCTGSEQTKPSRSFVLPVANCSLVALQIIRAHCNSSLLI